MKQIILSIALSAMLLTSCTALPMTHREGGQGMQMRREGGHGGGQGMQMRMGMGRNSGMMDRHHATVPDEYRGVSNPITADQDSLARGAELYTTNCASCHGDGGMGDGPAGKALDPAASPIAHTSQMLGDDYLFWRISEGGAEFSSTMPAWKSSLDEQSRWDLINYTRALGSGDVLPRQGMGGAAFDPALELAHRQEILDTAVTQEVITQAEAETFVLVHAAMDAYMADNRAESSRGNMNAQLAIMLESLTEVGEITREQSESFQDIHERLLEADLMQ